MARKIKGITIVLNAEATGLEKALKDVNDRSREINKELRDTNNLLRFSPDSTELMTQKQKLLEDQVKATSEKLETLRKVENQVAEQAKSGEISARQYRDFQKEIAQTESQLRNYEKQLREVESATVKLGKSMQETGKKWQDSGKSMTDVGKSLTKGITVPVAALGTMASKSAVDFETGMAGVRKTTDMTAEELDEMGQALREMAKEIPVSVNDLTELAETAGQLGIEKENLVSFTRVMADLAVATNIAGQEGATSMAQFANITQMAQTDFDKMGSAIVELGNNTATTEKDILNMATRLAAAGYQANMSQSDILGIAAGLASLGLESQAGGSAFSKVINQIQLEVDTSGEKLNDFARIAGMSASDFSKAWKEDAASALSKFVVGLGDTETQGKSTNEMLDELGITELRMGDALRRTSGANELFTETLAMSNRAWEENNALTEEASIKYETTESKLTIAKNKLNDTAIEIGDSLLPAIANAAEGVGDLAEKFSNLSPKTQTAIIKMGVFAAVLGPAITLAGKLKTAVGKLTVSLGGMVEKLGHGLDALGGFTSGGIAGAAIGIVTALTAAIVAYSKSLDSVPKSLEKFERHVESVNEDLKEQRRLLDLDKDHAAELLAEYERLSARENLSAGDKSRLAEIVKELSEMYPELIGHLNSETNELDLNNEAVERLIENQNRRNEMDQLNEERKASLEQERKLVELLADAEEDQAKAAAQFAKTGNSLDHTILQQKKETTEGIRALLEQNANDLISNRNQYDALADAIEDAEDRKSTAIESGSEKQKDAIRAMSDAYVEDRKKVADYLQQIEELADDNVDSMSRFSQKRIDLSNTTTREFMDNLIAEREAFTNYHDNLTEIAERVGPDVAKELEDLGPDAAPLIQQFVDGSDEQLEELKEIFGLRTEDAVKVAEDKIGELNGFPHGENWIQGLIDGMENKRAALKLAAQSLASEVVDVTSKRMEERSPSRVAMRSGVHWVEGLELGMESRRKELAEKSASIAKEINTATKEANRQLQVDLKKFDADYQYDREKAIRDYNKSVARIKDGARKERRQLAKDEHWELEDLKRSHDQNMLDMEERYQNDRLSMISQASIDVVAEGEEYVEQQKWLGEMSLSEEIIYWNDMRNSLERGTDAYEQALSNHQNAVARLRSQMEAATERYSEQVKKIDSDLAKETEKITSKYESEVKRVNDKRIAESEKVTDKLESDIERLNNTYQNSYDSRVSQLTNITGLFEKYQRKTAVPETALIRNLGSQVDALKDYSDAMDKIKGRVDNESLIAELEKLGPDSLAELDAINRMTDDQLAEFVSLYEERYRLASEQATEELAPLKADTEKQINELKDAAQRSLQEINRVANQELAQLQADMRAQLQELNQTAAEKLDELEMEWMQTVADIIGGSEKQFDSMRQVGLDAIGNLEQGLLDGESSLMTEANRIASKVQSVIASALNIPESSLPDSNAGIAAGQLTKLGTGTGGGTKSGNGTNSSPDTSGITQYITINSPDPLTPSEVARQTKNASQVLAMKW